MEDESLVVDILENIFGEPRNHNHGRGQISFDCPVCSHEIKGLEKGDGKGPMVESGAYSGVPNFANLSIAEGQMFYSIYYGKGLMGAHSTQLNKEEIWKVVHYIKKLQDDKYPAIQSTVEVVEVVETEEGIN